MLHSATHIFSSSAPKPSRFPLPPSFSLCEYNKIENLNNFFFGFFFSFRTLHMYTIAKKLFGVWKLFLSFENPIFGELLFVRNTRNKKREPNKTQNCLQNWKTQYSRISFFVLISRKLMCQSRTLPSFSLSMRQKRTNERTFNMLSDGLKNILLSYKLPPVFCQGKNV